jgi:hypothetical protein
MQSIQRWMFVAFGNKRDNCGSVRQAEVAIKRSYRNYPIFCFCRGSILAGGAERRFRRGGVGATVLFSVSRKEAQA